MKTFKPKLKQLKELDIKCSLKNISKQYNVEVKRVFHNEFLRSVLNQYHEKGTLTDKQVQALVNMHNGIKKYEENGKQYKENRAALRRSAEYERNNSRRSRYSSGNSNYAYNADFDDHPLNDLGSMGYLN